MAPAWPAWPAWPAGALSHSGSNSPEKQPGPLPLPLPSTRCDITEQTAPSAPAQPLGLPAFPPVLGPWPAWWEVSGLGHCVPKGEGSHSGLGPGEGGSSPAQKGQGGPSGSSGAGLPNPRSGFSHCLVPSAQTPLCSSPRHRSLERSFWTSWLGSAALLPASQPPRDVHQQ